MPRKKRPRPAPPPPVPTKPCEAARCRGQAVPGERFCPECRRALLKKMRQGD